MPKRQDQGVIVLSALEEDVATTLGAGKLYGKEILDLMNEVRRKVGMRPLGVGSLYPTLKRMEEANLIGGEWGEEVAESTRRRYYRLTAEGAQALSRTKAYRNLLARQNQSGLPDGQQAFGIGKWLMHPGLKWQRGV